MLRFTGFVIAGLLAANAAFAQAQSPEPTRHVVLLGIDGLRADSFVEANTPRLDAVMAEGAWTLEAVSSTGQRTSSGPAWSSILTGVWADKHGVADNSFEGRNFDAYPSFLIRVRRALPEPVTASFVHWAPINNRIPHEADHERRMIPDAVVTQETVRVITEVGPHATFVQLDDVDGAGHANGFHPGNAQYLEAVATADGFVGDILDAVAARKAAHPNEEWLVIIVTDHGGTESGSHGGLTPEEIIVPYFLIGDGVEQGELEATVANVDAPVTALAFLGIALDPEWDLDGTPRGLAGR